MRLKVSVGSFTGSETCAGNFSLKDGPASDLDERSLFITETTVGVYLKSEEKKVDI